MKKLSLKKRLFTSSAGIALLLGILALRQLKRKPRLHGHGRAIFGIIMGAIFSICLVLMVIGLIASGVG